MSVIYSDGEPKPRLCPNHTHRRPIKPSLLWLRIRVREEIEKQHRWHFMPEPGCPLCNQPRGAER